MINYRVHGRQVWGNQIAYYAKGIMNVSINLAREYLLWKGLDISKGEGLKYNIVLGDSMLVIKSMRNSTNPTKNALSTLIITINKSLRSFEKIMFYHV
jgi:hypothetical protein